MTLALTQIEFRGSRRVRLTFSGPPAAGAYTSTAYYAVATGDSAGPAPINVTAVFALASDPNTIELAVDTDFVSGEPYTVAGTAVPMSSGGPFTGSLTSAPAAIVQAAIPNAEPETSDLDDLLYNRDLVWNGLDIVEDATGDLAEVNGQANYQGALTRRVTSEALLWDQSYGAEPDQYVDAPSLYSRALAGRFLSQARADDRTATASISTIQDPNNPGDWWFTMIVTGRDGLAPIAVALPSVPLGV